MKPLFKNISNFSNIGDYLPILNGILFVELFMIYLSLSNRVKSKFLQKWYKKYGLSAVIADVLVIFLGIVIVRFLYPFIFKEFNIVLFVLLGLAVQITHDILFYLFFTSIPRGVNTMLDLFKDYAKEVSTGAIIGDSQLMVCSILSASFFANYSTNANIISLVFNLYFLPYILNT